MTRPGFFERHRIVRSAIRDDLVFFGVPAFLVFTLGLIVSARDGYDGLLRALFEVITHPRDLHLVPAHELVGLALLVVGLTVAITGVYTLKRFYASTLVVREGHRVITHGVYRFVRHPIYLGVLVVCVGAVPVYAWSLYGVLTMSILIPLFLNRIRMEEKLLIAQLGDAYRAYQRTTRKLIPFVH